MVGPASLVISRISPLYYQRVRSRLLDAVNGGTSVTNPDSDSPDVADGVQFNCSLRLEAQDVALSRLKHGFESRRERQT
jgi:hypothetical protein